MVLNQAEGGEMPKYKPTNVACRPLRDLTTSKAGYLQGNAGLSVG
jgi:hypothetical protein